MQAQTGRYEREREADKENLQHLETRDNWKRSRHGRKGEADLQFYHTMYHTFINA